jgi:hypothetical protein
MGFDMRGPLPLMTSNSMPRAGRGVRMSENMMTPSVWKERKGCRDSSMAMEEVSERCLKGMRSEYLRKSAM